MVKVNRSPGLGALILGIVGFWLTTGMLSAADPAKAPTKPKPTIQLAQADVEQITNIMQDPELAKLNEALTKAQEIAAAYAAAFRNRQEAQKLKLDYLLTVELPAKYKLPGYIYDVRRGWVEKPAEPAPAK